jgi:hypothetical protein
MTSQAKLAALEMLDGTWSLRDTIDLYDTFEPTYMQRELEDEINLGHLVFGEQLFSELGGRRSSTEDALTALYRAEGPLSINRVWPTIYSVFLSFSTGSLHSPTFLREDVYTPLFLPKELMDKTHTTHRETFTYQGKKQIWSLTRNYPANAVHGLPVKWVNPPFVFATYSVSCTE